MRVSDTNKNRGAHGDSSFMLGGLPSSSENPPASAVGSVKTGEKKKIEPTYPPINWLRAAMIDRKNQLKLSWDDIGEAVGTTGGALRQLMYSTPDPWDWPQYTRQKVCRVLGVETRQYVVGSPEDPCR